MNRVRLGPRILRVSASLLLVLLLAVGLSGFSWGLNGPGGADVVYAQNVPPGCNGDNKVHPGELEPVPVVRNVPKVCSFEFHGFNFDPGTTIVWWVETQPGDTRVLEGQLTVGDNGEVRTDVYNLPIGMYKLFWHQIGCPGGEKQKVFKVDCEPPAEMPVATPTNTATPTPGNTPTNTPTATPPSSEPGPTNTPTPGSSVEQPTNTPTAAPQAQAQPTNTPLPAATPVVVVLPAAQSTAAPVVIVLPVSQSSPTPAPVLVQLPATGLGGSLPIDPPIAGFTIAMLAAIRLALSVRGGRRDD